MFTTMNIDFSNVLSRSEFGYLEFEAEKQLEMIIDYLKINETAVIENQSKFKDYYDKLQKDANEEEWEDNYFEHQEAIENHAYYFPNLFYSSMFVMVSNFFEEYMYNILDNFTDLFQVKKTIPKKHQKDKKLSGVKNYIVEFTGIPFSSMNAKWDALEKYLSYRNFIVHENSNLNNIKDKTYKKQLEASLKRSPNFYVLSDGKVICKDSQHLHKYIELVKEVTHHILIKAEKVYIKLEKSN